MDNIEISSIKNIKHINKKSGYLIIFNQINKSNPFKFKL